MPRQQRGILFLQKFVDNISLNHPASTDKILSTSAIERLMTSKS
jgi:hypothetical protein